MSARSLALLLSLAVAGTLTCSKTQDTAPERRIFGEPPTIVSVDPVFAVADAQVECNFTDVMYGLFCGFGFTDVEIEAGTGWTLVNDAQGKPQVVHSDTPTPDAGIRINGEYTEFTFKAQVTDPNSTPGNNNILLVSSSYVSPESSVETSLVLFNDASETNFPINQSSSIFENCASQTCPCEYTHYDIRSGDADKSDDIYTRKFLVINQTAPNFLKDCIMKELHVVGGPAAPNSKFEFKIEAVDRQGNLTVWPNKLVASTGSGRFACEGDSCGCCMLHYQNSLIDLCQCLDEPGMISPSQTPNGFCVDYLRLPPPGPDCHH